MTNSWTLRNVKPDTAESLRVICGNSNGVFSKILEPGGKTYQVTCTVSSPQSTVSFASPIPAPLIAGRMIEVSDRALDALARVAQSEVGHFGKYGKAQLAGGLAAVVDTVINRVAHKNYPDSIEAVIDQPKQFSAVNGPGTWVGLDPAQPTVMEIVRTHVAGRASGVASMIKGATHFLNPHISSAVAMASWGRYVVENAVAVYGDDAERDVHYHGFPPGGTLPDTYSLRFNGVSAAFEGDGSSPGGLPVGSELRDAIVRICWKEYAFFDNGAAKETDDPQFKRVGEYWKVIGRPFTGKDTNQFWSAAFVSFVLDQAGAGARFPGAAAHCLYFQHFVNALDHYALYEALPQSDAVPEVGDILHYGRDTAKTYDFAKAATAFAADGWYPSHGDIVVEKRADTLITIGGNVLSSVGRKTVMTDDQGRLIDRQEDGQNFPWIGILKLRA
ncbi:DUF2272 domain-containing protein [Azospirillum lipoferum]|nr:DUF2272 domain-containing protein [Azospirillum lipoferum]